jgi:hypothetical protein
MTKGKITPLIGKTVQLNLTSRTLLDYRIMDVGQIYVFGNGPGQGHSPVRLTDIKSIVVTKREVIS